MVDKCFDGYEDAMEFLMSTNWELPPFIRTASFTWSDEWIVWADNKYGQSPVAFFRWIDK